MINNLFKILGAILIASPIYSADLGGRILDIGSDTTYPPHESIDPNTGEVVGFDVDVVAEICKKINCKPNWVTTAWDGMIQAVADGQYMIAGDGISITAERDKIVDFSDSYIVLQQRMLVAAGNDDITSAADIQNGDFKVCLLYTSPSPRDRSVSRMPSSA